MPRIVMANICMPIRVNDDGLEPLSEYIKIQIEPCEELPEKNKDTDGSIMEKINNILSKGQNINHETTVPSIFVTIDEILEQRPKKNRKNLSLKNTSKTMSRYTMKNYNVNQDKNLSNLNALDADPSLQQAVQALE
jgi:hypothetical protein